MIELAILGVLVLFALCVLTYVTGRRAGFRLGLGERHELEYPKPFCGCTHHFALHDNRGACGFIETTRILIERGQPTTKLTGQYGSTSKIVYEHERYETQTIPCPCKGYTGPEPLPTYIP